MEEESRFAAAIDHGEDWSEKADAEEAMEVNGSNAVFQQTLDHEHPTSDSPQDGHEAIQTGLESMQLEERGKEKEAPEPDEAEEDEIEEDKKRHLNIVFIGHVDAGKSTTGGQILLLSGQVYDRTIQKYEKEAKEKN